MKKYLNLMALAGLIIAHLILIATVIYFFWPFARWYLKFLPLWGVDFHLTATITNLINNNFVLPYAFWNYAGFGGWPAFYYPSLHAYAIHFVSKFFDFIVAIQYWMMVSSALFIIGAYFLFWVVSRNIFLATALAIATAFSAGVYQTLTWAGSLPSFATQAFFPWTLAFLVLYLRSKSMRFLLISALIAGISVWGHPIIFLAYIAPASLFLIFFSFDKRTLFKKIKNSLVFFGIIFVIGLPLFYPTLINFSAGSFFQTGSSQKALSTTTVEESEYLKGIEQYNRDQVKRLFSDNHPLPFYLIVITLPIFVFGFLVSRKIKAIVNILPYLLIAAFFAFYIWLFGEGISIYHGGWYRLFWSVPVWIGLVSCALLKEGLEKINSKLTSWYIKFLLVIGATIAILIVGYVHLSRYDSDRTIFTLHPRSQASSAYPDILNIKTSNDERLALKSRLVPQWMNGDDTNWRLYDGDQTVNLWWSSLFMMPLARGYLDPPTERGYIFWLDAALSETKGQAQLVEVFKYPLETAISNAFFLIDWNAIRYYEGGHESDSFTPMPKHLGELIVDKNEMVDFNDEKHTKRSVTLNYYKLKDEVASPILLATNAASLGIFASDGGYEAVIRAIAERDNINSQKLIPVRLGKFIDKYDLKTLKNFDAIYLYDYDYKKEEKTFKMLTEYARSGRKVFIETGVEVKQSEGDLPEFFPVKKVRRKGQDREWNFEAGSNSLTQGVNFGTFSPSVFDDDEWKTSSASVDQIRDGASVLLKNHDRVVLASHKLGSGEVIWSGLNFAYHVSRNHNQEEAKLFNNILGEMVDLGKKPLPEYKSQFVNANRRLIDTKEAKGILFKEQGYNGWSAQNGSKKLKIFKAGPANPGFMYLPLATEGMQKVILEFSGDQRHKLMFFLSMFTIILTADEAVFRGIFIGKARSFVWSKLKLRLNRWWMREDEG